SALRHLPHPVRTYARNRRETQRGVDVSSVKNASAPARCSCDVGAAAVNGADGPEVRLRAALMFVALGAIACRGNPDADPDDTAPPGDDPAVAPSVHVTWSGSQVASTLEVEIDDPAGRTSWSFGMAETEAGEAGWYGEDCFVGLGAYTHCHAFEGDTLVLQRVRTPA